MNRYKLLTDEVAPPGIVTKIAMHAVWDSRRVDPIWGCAPVYDNYGDGTYTYRGGDLVFIDRDWGGMLVSLEFSIREIFRKFEECYQASIESNPVSYFLLIPRNNEDSYGVVLFTSSTPNYFDGF